jgi:alpha-ketoglutarate-dependent taurine dioxygenase
MERIMNNISPAATHYRTDSGLVVRRLQPAIGAEISGIDLSAEIPAAAATDMRKALLAHGVICLRNQNLDYESHLAFTRVFGDPIDEFSNGGRSKVLEVKSRGGSREGTASTWHSDGCYMEIPPAISVLRSVTVPPLGGDTCFSSAVAAYRDLSDVMKKMLAPLRFSSSGAFLFSRGSSNFFDDEETKRRKIAFPDVTHPVIRVHPETGEPAIYVNRAQSLGIVGLDNDLGQVLLKYLADLMKQPEYQTRWRWEPNAVIVWDNRAVQHYGVPDQVSERHMERIMVAGTATLSLADWEARIKA